MLEKCKFCKRFIEARYFLREPVRSNGGKNIVDRRRCIIAGGLVSPEDGCDQLILATTVWCRKNEQWMYREACVKRYIKKEETECKKCGTGNELVRLTRRMGTKTRKRKLLIRKKNGG